MAMKSARDGRCKKMRFQLTCLPCRLAFEAASLLGTGGLGYRTAASILVYLGREHLIGEESTPCPIERPISPILSCGLHINEVDSQSVVSGAKHGMSFAFSVDQISNYL
jgi:hypothetical protein